MIRERDLIGLPILKNNYELSNYEVKDIFYSLENLYIFGLSLQPLNATKNTSFVAYNKIKTITNDGILLWSLNDILDVNQISEIEDITKTYRSLIGYEIYSHNGDIIGVVKDILIQIKSGKILGLIISEGLIDDLINGYSFLPLLEDIEFDQYKIILKNNKILEILPQQGGLKKMLGIDLKN